MRLDGNLVVFSGLSREYIAFFCNFRNKKKVNPEAKWPNESKIDFFYCKNGFHFNRTPPPPPHTHTQDGLFCVKVKRIPALSLPRSIMTKLKQNKLFYLRLKWIPFHPHPTANHHHPAQNGQIRIQIFLLLAQRFHITEAFSAKDQ